MSDSAVIVIPSEYAGSEWRITHPRLKLGLKYGLIGPWSHWNWSQEFDAYTAGRGPRHGPASLTDLVMTTLMNSRVSTANLKDVSTWIAQKEFKRRIQRLCSVLSPFPSLLDAPDDAARLIGETAQAIWDMDPKRGGMGMAKSFKWLSAWAPEHVPMIDKLVWTALKHGSTGLGDAVSRFRQLCIDNEEVLARLMRWLNSRLAAMGSSAKVSRVRVLDSLIWFDWMIDQRYRHDFDAFVRMGKKGASEHPLTPLGGRVRV